MKINGNFFVILSLIFITLKLCGVINWPWIYILLTPFAPVIFLVSIGFSYIAIKKMGDFIISIENAIRK